MQNYFNQDFDVAGHVDSFTKPYYMYFQMLRFINQSNELMNKLFYDKIRR